MGVASDHLTPHIPGAGRTLLLRQELFVTNISTRDQIMAKAPKTKLKTPTDLKTNQAATVADALNGILADSFALYFKTKNFHWHVSGPHFRDYHLLFDDQAAQIFATTDLIAERIRKTGNTTLRSIGDVSRHQSLTDNNADYVSPAAMLSELRDDNLKMIEVLRAAKDLADEAKDNATSAVIDNWTDDAEQRAWFLFEAAQTA
jgi:starvation-inducible DNA-binding protein